MTDSTFPASGWHVELRGSDSSIMALATAADAPNWSIRSVAGTHYLIGEFANDSPNASDVRREARCLLGVLNPAAKLQFSGYQFVDVGAVVHGDPEREHRTTQFIDAATLSGTLILAGTLQVDPNAEEPPRPKPLSLLALVTALQNDEAVREVLGEIRQDSDEWGTRYNRILELIQMDMGSGSTNKGHTQMASLGWATPDAIDRFKGIVNNRKAAGLGARHATSRPVPAGIDSPQDAEAVARGFIHSLIEQWMRWKYTATPI